MMSLLGSCLCGTFRYRIDSPAAYSGFCHCSQCRKFSGSAFNALLGVKAADLIWIECDEKQLGCFWKSSTTRMRFCMTCGSSLFVEKLSLRMLHLRMGTLDSEPSLAPQGHAFVGSKACWYNIADGLPEFAELPPEMVVATPPQSRAPQCTDTDAGARVNLQPPRPERDELVATDKATFELCLRSPKNFARQSAVGVVMSTDYFNRDRSDELLGRHTMLPEGYARYAVRADLLEAPR
jgi:hypothetical protein